jgi:flavin reductase
VTDLRYEGRTLGADQEPTVSDAPTTATGRSSTLAARRELDELGFRAALGSWVTGVSVMTSVVDGEPHGMTANSVTSVSLDPQLVLVCVGRTAVMAEVVTRGRVFALSFLAEEQAELSLAFADPDRPEGTAQFADVTTVTAVTGAPIVEGASGWVDCEVTEVHEGGDHLIVIGRVVAVGADEDVPPLAYSRGTYGRFHAAED